MRKIIFLLFFLFSSIFASELKNDENLTIGELANGFKYYIFKNTTPKNSADFYLYINAGSTNETDEEQGLAHFVEHMVFNGTTDFSKNSLITTLEGLGVKFGPDLNAATSFDQTFYELHIKTSQKALNSAFKVFENMAGKVLFNKKDLDAERGIIVEEDRQRNTSEFRVFKQEMPYIFGDSIYSKRLPIGKMDIINSTTPEVMKEFYHKNYQPKNMSFIAVGDFNVEEIKKLIKKSFSFLKDGKPNLVVSRKIPFFNKFVAFNASEPEVKFNAIRIYYEGNYTGGINTFKKFKNNVINNYISNLIGLINQKRQNEENSLESIEFEPENIQNQKMLYVFSENVNNLDFNRSIKDIFKVINGIKKFGFNKDDFLSVKKDFLNSAKASFKARNTRSNSYYSSKLFSLIENNSTFLSPYENYELTKKALNEISLDDINKEFRKITDAKGIIVELLSQKPQVVDDNFIKKCIDEKVDIFDTLGTKKLPKTLLDENLSLQKPIKEANLGNGIERFEFSNGATLFFKNLKTKKNEVRFLAIKRGGYSNIRNKKLARIALGISNGSGIGKFNQYEVSKITAGENFGLSKFINEIALGYSGYSTTNDASNLMKAFYVLFNNIKIDKNYEKRFITLFKDSLINNQTNPEFKFKKEFLEFYYDDKEMQAISIKDLDNLNSNKMLKILQDNFKNASDYAFIVVGDIDKNSTLNLAGRYIANLSGDKNQKSVIKDDGIRPKFGDFVFFRDFLNENKAQVSIYTGARDTNFSIKNSYILNATNEVLNVLMREKIREKDSRVYGIYATSNLSKYPYERSKTTISFSSSPENAPKVVQSVKDLIKYTQTTLVDEKYLNNYKKSKKISIKKTYEWPSTWISEISSFYVNGLDFKNFGYESDAKFIDSITTEDIRKGANRYFNLKDFIISELVKKGTKNSYK